MLLFRRMEIQSLDEGRLTANRQYVPLLRANRLESFESVMKYPGGEIHRDFPGRRTVRLELKDPEGAIRPVFLKRYESHYLSPFRRMLRLLRWPGAEDEAIREWHMLQQVSTCGIPTPIPIAVGQSTMNGA